MEALKSFWYDMLLDCFCKIFYIFINCHSITCDESFNLKQYRILKKISLRDPVIEQRKVYAVLDFSGSVSQRLIVYIAKIKIFSLYLRKSANIKGLDLF
jgi:hypothetical protein